MILLRIRKGNVKSIYTYRSRKHDDLNIENMERDGMNIEAVFEQLPNLKSEGFVLKKIEDYHLEEVFEIYNNDKVFEYCGIIPKHNKDTVKNMIGHFERDFNKRSRVKWGYSPVLNLIGCLELLKLPTLIKR